MSLARSVGVLGMSGVVIGEFIKTPLSGCDRDREYRNKTVYSSPPLSHKKLIMTTTEAVIKKPNPERCLTYKENKYEDGLSLWL